jgi:hypothetical protein
LPGVGLIRKPRLDRLRVYAFQAAPTADV